MCGEWFFRWPCLCRLFFHSARDSRSWYRHQGSSLLLPLLLYLLAYICLCPARHPTQIGKMDAKKPPLLDDDLIHPSQHHLIGDSQSLFQPYGGPYASSSHSLWDLSSVSQQPLLPQQPEHQPNHRRHSEQLSCVYVLWFSSPAVSYFMV